MARKEELTDEQWAVLESLIPPTIRRSDGRGRPEMHDNRAVLNGILWVLRTGAAWADLPERFPSGSTCFRRFSRWVKEGIFRQILETLARHLEEVGQIDLSECFIDGTFVLAKKGSENWKKNKRGKGTKLMDFHSLCTRLLLAHMKSPLSKLRSLKPSRWDDPDDLSGIVPTTVIRSIKSWHKWE